MIRANHISIIAYSIKGLVKILLNPMLIKFIDFIKGDWAN